MPAVQVNISQPSKAAHSLGIASVILGILAFLICWIPLIGIVSLPLSGLGLLLGIVGLVLAAIRHGHGIGFPIAGTAISILALLITFSMTLAIGTAMTAVGRTARQARKDTAQLEWVDAGTSSITQGDVRVSIAAVEVGLVDISSFGTSSQLEKNFLRIGVQLENIGTTKKVDYRGWGTLDALTSTPRMRLLDNFDNNYTMFGLGFGVEIEGQVKSDSIYPGKQIEDLLVFEPPLESIEYLRLELPTSHFGEDGTIRFQIPNDMIAR